MKIDPSLAIKAAKEHDSGKTPEQIAKQEEIGKPVAIRRIVRGYELLRERKASALKRIRIKAEEILKDIDDLQKFK